jgi:hypothetical protein
MRAPSLRRLLPPVLALAAGLLTALWPLVESGFAEIPGGRDAQLVGYSLEHSYRFLIRDELHRDFWDPPIFYPARNVAAYTDTVLSLAPFYWPWRLFGLAPDSAFQVWLLSMWVLDFLAFFVYLRRIFGLGSTAAAAGAFLFAFGSSRVANTVHPQLVPAFYLVAALYALHRVFDADLARRRRQGWVLAFVLALVLQVWGAVYPAFFFAFVCGLALLVALAWRAARAALVSTLRATWPAWIASGLLAAMLTAPLVQRYRLTAATHGGRPWVRVQSFQPRWYSWLLMGTRHRVWGFVYDAEPLAGRRSLHYPTHANGLGLVALTVVAIGFYRNRRRPAVRLMVAASALAILATTSYPGGFTVWRFFYEHLPGAAAIRAVGRIGMLLLIPAGLGAGLFLDGMRYDRRRSQWLAAAILLLLAVEQAHDPDAYDKLAARRRAGAIAAAVEPGCRSFFVRTTVRQSSIHEDAMWASLLAGVPTVNGRYGNFPRGYRLYDEAFPRRALKAAEDAGPLADWLGDNCLAAEDVCRVDWPADRAAVPVRIAAAPSSASCSGAGGPG